MFVHAVLLQPLALSHRGLSLRWVGISQGRFEMGWYGTCDHRTGLRWVVKAPVITGQV